MTRKEKYPDTKYFKYYNANPKNKITTDCVVRAITLASNQPYEDIVKRLVDIHIKTGYESTDKKNFEKLISDLGFIKNPMPKKADGTKYSVLDFIKEHPQGTYIISMAHHLTVVKNGQCWDIWDCVKFGGKIGNYWS